MNAITLTAPTSMPMNGGIQASTLLPQRFQMVRATAAGTNGGALVKTQLFGRPIPELLSYAQNMFNMMEGNQYFPEPMPSQDEFGALVTQAKAASQRAGLALIEYKAAITGRDEIIRRLTAAIDKRASYVQAASMGIANRIVSAGVGIRNARRKVGPLEPPTGLTVELSVATGVAILTWDKVMNARGYLLEYGPVDGSMETKVFMGRRKQNLEGLSVGVMYQFRLSALGGSTGQSYWSPWVKRAAA